MSTTDEAYVYGTAATWDEWRQEWRDSGTTMDFHTWFCQRLSQIRPTKDEQAVSRGAHALWNTVPALRQQYTWEGIKFLAQVVLHANRGVS